MATVAEWDRDPSHTQTHALTHARTYPAPFAKECAIPSIKRFSTIPRRKT